LGPRTVFLVEDETDLRLFPPLRAGWRRRGQSAPVRITGRNAKRVVFGTLNPRTGHRVLLCRHRHRSEDFQVYLAMVRWHYRGWSIVLLLDEDSCHTAKASLRLAKKLGIKLIFLPKRSPHLNPMDHLWRDGKQKVCANRQYPTVEVEVDRFIEHILGLTPGDALRKAGVLSKEFWLRNLL